MQTAAYLCVVRDFSNAALIAHLSFSAAESTGMACIPKKPIALNCAYKRENGEAMSRLLCRKVCPSTKRFLSYVKSLRAGRVIQQEFEQWPNKRRVRVGVINGGKLERGSDELDISALEDETKMRVEKGTKGKSDEDQWARIQSLGIAGSLPNEAKSIDLINAEDQATKAASSANKSSKKGVGAVATAAKSTAMAEVSTVLLVDNREAVVIDDTAKGAAETKQEYNRFRKNNDALFWRKVGKAKDADEALGMICEEEPGRKGEISSWECSQLILAAVEEDNLDLAFSILDAMRRSSLLPKEIVQKQDKLLGDRNDFLLRWAQLDVSIYSTFIRGFAASLRVSDAINIVAHMCRHGVPVGEEVAFGKVISCPTCTKALAVVQPQHGTQLVPCSRCRYNYELMSGDVVSFRSESTSNDWSMIQKWLRWLRLVDRPLPAAVHSFVVQDPNGIARTLRFATETVDVPAQEGERVTFASAAPATAERGIGPFRMSMRTPGWRPSEPMAITNHVTGRITSLLRAPPKSGSGAAFDNAFIVPAALAFASGDVATTFIDPTLPHLIAAYAVATVALGGAVNLFIYPRLNQLPQRTVDAIALRQELLVQYESLQQRIQDLAQVASSEVRMMARMFQLQNKMEAVGEPTYGARIVRVVKAREGIYQQLLTRLELIDKYAKVASMIEIEVEMDVDVLAAEAVGAVEHIMEQVAHLIEAEDLQKKWRTQAEASDEVERLLNTAPLSNSS